MSANIEQIKAMLERAGKTNLLQKQTVDLDKERTQLEAAVNIEKIDKNLEEEIRRYLREECSSDDEPTTEETARHFAEWQKEKIITLIQSRLSEIIGDAQPKPALRAELRELIEKIKEDEE